MPRPRPGSILGKLLPGGKKIDQIRIASIFGGLRFNKSKIET